MTTLGTIVDLASEAPEILQPLADVIRGILARRPEDRAAVLERLRLVATTTHATFERAEARLHERFPDDRGMRPDPERNGAGHE